MPTAAAKRWIEAGKVLAQDEAARVRCPDNDDGFLGVHDEVTLGSIERYLVCETCGARNVIRMLPRRE